MFRYISVADLLKSGAKEVAQASLLLGFAAVLDAPKGTIGPAAAAPSIDFKDRPNSIGSGAVSVPAPM